MYYCHVINHSVVPQLVSLSKTLLKLTLEKLHQFLYVSFELTALYFVLCLILVADLNKTEFATVNSAKAIIL